MGDIKQSDIHVDFRYYAQCSDCESVSEDWLNQVLVIEDITAQGWRKVGSRLVCADCGAKYPAEESHG